MRDLERIERYAAHVLNDAISLRQAVRMVHVKPNFETRAEDEMKRAKDQLDQSIEVVTQALNEFSTKPVTA